MDNNPRVFGEVVSLEVWRTEYNTETGTAALHINAKFQDGRIRSEGTPRVSFRLRLRSAEIFIRPDSTSTIKLQPGSALVPSTPEGKRTVTNRQALEASAAAAAGITVVGPTASMNAGAKSRMSAEVTTTYSSAYRSITFLHGKKNGSHIYCLEPVDQSYLNGLPWDYNTKVLSLRDTRMGRKKGEPPEPSVEIRCKREDIDITDIKLVDEREINLLSRISMNKLKIVENYIKDELARLGFGNANMSDPFEDILIADAYPECE